MRVRVRFDRVWVSCFGAAKIDLAVSPASGRVGEERERERMKGAILAHELAIVVGKGGRR